eukprot:COSAG05_NODE_1129_length_5779_cov_11.914789_6_plen_118_part_00
MKNGVQQLLEGKRASVVLMLVNACGAHQVVQKPLARSIAVALDAAAQVRSPLSTDIARCMQPEFGRFICLGWVFVWQPQSLQLLKRLLSIHEEENAFRQQAGGGRKKRRGNHLRSQR